MNPSDIGVVVAGPAEADQFLQIEGIGGLAAHNGGIAQESVGLTAHGSILSFPFRSKPPACFFRAAFVRFRRPPWRLFFAIA